MFFLWFVFLWFIRKPCSNSQNHKNFHSELLTAPINFFSLKAKPPMNKKTSIKHFWVVFLCLVTRFKHFWYYFQSLLFNIFPNVTNNRIMTDAKTDIQIIKMKQKASYRLFKHATMTYRVWKTLSVLSPIQYLQRNGSSYCQCLMHLQ